VKLDHHAEKGGMVHHIYETTNTMDYERHQTANPL